MFKKYITFILISLLASGTSYAADKSVNNKMSDVTFISPNKTTLTPKEATGLKLANQWKDNPTKPVRSADGSVKYLYGATLPTLICSPLDICTIQLQMGEIVSDLHAGDTARWKISPATSGTGTGKTTYIIVKPIDAGLTTNLFITTDRRTYMIKLSSTQKEWIPVLSFVYPDDSDLEWKAYKTATDTNRTTLPSGQNIAGLDFNFRISGAKTNWRPTRVYTDGYKTYIELPGDGIRGEAPALVSVGDGGGLFKKPKEQLVNYRVIGNRYVVDKVITKVALISGVGSHQKKIIITRSH